MQLFGCEIMTMKIIAIPFNITHICKNDSPSLNNCTYIESKNKCERNIIKLRIQIGNQIFESSEIDLFTSITSHFSIIHLFPFVMIFSTMLLV